MEKLNLSSPRMTYVHEFEALFAGDPDVTVRFEEDKGEKEIKLFVSGENKARDLQTLLPEKTEFGTEEVRITIRPRHL